MTYLRDIQRQKARSVGSGRESDVRNNCFGPSWYCRHVSLEYLSVHHPKQQTGFLIVNGIVVDISTVSNLADPTAVKDGLVVTGNDFSDRDIVTAFHHTTGNPRGVYRRMVRGNEENPDEEASLMGTTDVIKFVFCGKNSLKYQALLLTQAFLTEFFAVLYRLHDGFTRVPVAELVLSNLVGIDIDGILHPLMLKNLRGYGRLARTIRPSNDNENGFMGGGYHATLIFRASCRICSKKRLVASSLVRFASSAASLINCERTASDGSSMLVNRYVSIVGFITMLFTISGTKVRN